VMTDAYWWVLGNDCQVFDYSFSPHPEADRLDYLVLTADGSGRPGVARPVPPYLAGYVEEHFVPIHDNLNREPLRLCGLTRFKAG